MSESWLSLPLAKDWIGKLWTRLLEERARRREELEKIQNVFGNPELLAQYYIEPDCQRTNPADFHEEEVLRTFRQPISNWLNGFLDGEVFERDGRNTLFVLSDAGMGKSSLLTMLKLSHLMNFWPSDLDFRLLKLGPDTLDALDSLKQRNKTVLLLDALDEDPEAWGQVEPRLRALLDIGKSFRQVIITCRTQFFPKGGRTPVESPEKIEIAGYVCNLIYLAPFNKVQVETYLQKRFPNTVLDRVTKFFTKVDNQKLVKAREIVEPMQSLRIRPMLLAYVDMLLDTEIEEHNEYSIYRALIDCWLLREERKPEGGIKKEILLEACLVVALHLQQTEERTLTREALDALISDHSIAQEIRSIDVRGRSLLNVDSAGDYRFAHYSIQEFLVAHRLITEGEKNLGGTVRATDQLLSFLYAWIREDPQNNLEKIPWSRVEFKGLDLRGMLLPASLRGVDLSDTDLRETNILEVDLTGALLEGARLDLPTIDDVEFVVVPGGEFTLGEGAMEHSVRLSPFMISKCPITNAQYGQFLTANPDVNKPEYWEDDRLSKPDQPLVGVSWLDAMAYCRWAGFTLPTEAQWEAAARGKDKRPYPWGEAKPTSKFANYEASKLGGPSPVGAYPQGAGPYGTLDQAGNVWEWCLDVYDEKAYERRGGKLAPCVTGNDQDLDSFRVFRGGCWASPALSLVSALRRRNRARFRSRLLGFRVCSVFGPEHG